MKWNKALAALALYLACAAPANAQSAACAGVQLRTASAPHWTPATGNTRFSAARRTFPARYAYELPPPIYRSLLLLPRWTADELPFFCRIEHTWARVHRVPLKFRLGSVDYVDWLEGKGRFTTFGP